MNGHREQPTDEQLFYLERKGFKWLGITSTYRERTGDWLFMKGGKVYDLSAADLEQIDRIELKGLFVVED